MRTVRQFYRYNVPETRIERAQRAVKAVREAATRAASGVRIGALTWRARLRLRVARLWRRVLVWWRRVTRRARE